MTPTPVPAGAPQPPDCGFADVDAAKAYLGDAPIAQVGGQDVDLQGEGEYFACWVTSAATGPQGALDVQAGVASPGAAHDMLEENKSGEFGCSTVPVAAGPAWTDAVVMSCDNFPDGVVKLYLVRTFDTWDLTCFTNLADVAQADLEAHGTYNSEREAAFLDFCNATLNNLA